VRSASVTVTHNPQSADYEEHVRASFVKQGFMGTLGPTSGPVSPGLVEIIVRSHPPISQ
jgi:hypothetical protein